MSQEHEMGAGNHETEQADDVATLYSWANLHGAKYRDFSNARHEMRAQMRQRTLAEQARAAREDALQPTAGSVDSQTEWEDELSEPAARVPGAPAPAVSLPERAPASQSDSFPDVRYEQPVVRTSSESRVQTPVGAAYPQPPRFEPAPQRGLAESRSQPPGNGLHPSGTRYALPVRDAEYGPTQRASGTRPAEPAPAGSGPAWLAEKRTSGSQSQPTESLQQSRERVASRWFALQGIFGRDREEPVASGGGENRIPALTVFSLAGGVGKSTLVATLGRALASRGERVLLADTCAFGLLPFYLGAREVKPGVVRTFSGAPGDPPIRVLTLDSDRETVDADLLRREIGRAAQDVGRVLIDVPTGSLSLMRQAVRLSSVVIVPILPDMASVVTLQSLDSFFRNQEAAGGRPVQAWYLLNQFDPSVALHLDLREVLRQQLGEQLLPFAIHRSTAFSEALAEGMTVFDYAPQSPAVEDWMNLVTWVRSASAATAAGHRGARWSER